MRWLYNAPGEPGSDYCRACYEETRDPNPCAECPRRTNALIYPEFKEVVDLFLLCGEQWRVAEMTGRRLCLDMPGVKATADMAGITIDREKLDVLKLMERTALRVDQENHAKTD